MPTVVLSTRPAVADWCREFAGRRTSLTACRARLAAAVILLDRLKWAYELDRDAHFLPDGKFHGFHDEVLRRALYPFAWTLGALRTIGKHESSVPPAIDSLLSVLIAAQLEYEPEFCRQVLLKEAQHSLLGHVRSRLCRRSIRLTFEPTHVTANAVRRVIQTVAAEGKADTVAAHLVAAHLSLHNRVQEFARGVEASNRFHVGHATFYVTMRPRPGHFESMKHDALVGLSPQLLVPRDRLAGAKDQAEDTAPGMFTARSIEEFLSQRPDIARPVLAGGFRADFGTLIDAYNERVTRLESDESLLIEFPKRIA